MSSQLPSRGNDACDAAVFNDRASHRRLCAHVGARLSGGTDEDLVESGPANAQDRRPVIATTSSTNTIRARSIGGANFNSDSSTPIRSSTRTPAG
jgi:hypothetical protein